MKLIPFLGVLIFLKPLLINKSKRALLILINGMMYHGLKTYENENTKIIEILKYNDILREIDETRNRENHYRRQETNDMNSVFDAANSLMMDS